MKQTLRFAALFVPFFLAACDGGVQDALGLNREAPDEFTVVSRPPLSVPPEFTLRPPQPGAPALGFEADEKARSLLTGKDSTSVAPVTSSDTQSGGAASLLKRAGAANADSSIRDKLQTDAATPVDTSDAPTLLDQITGAEKREPVVDAKKEAERLRTNKDTGKPVNEGEVPEEKSGSESLIDRVF